MKYLSLDIETLGLDPQCSVLEICFVEEDTEHPEIPVEDLPYQNFLFRPESIKAEPFALGMHLKNSLLEECLKWGGLETSTWDHIERYLADYKARVGQPLMNCSKVGTIILAGKNVTGFDLKFFPGQIKKYFHYRAIDPGSMFPELFESVVPSLNQILEHCGIKPDNNHRAFGDAKDVIRVIRYAMSKNP